MEKYFIDLLEELASKGNEEAMLDLIHHYLFDEYISKSKAQQIKKFLIFLAEKQNTQAMLLLAGQYYVGTNIFNQNYKEAVKLYKKAGDQLDQTGHCYLGYCYLYGRGIPKDLEQAYICFSNSAYKGNPNAMYKLGDMYLNGLFVKKNQDTAFFWFNEAWLKVDDQDLYEKSSIAYRLGKCLIYGFGVEENLIEALGLLQFAEYSLIQLLEKNEPFVEETLKNVKFEIEEVRKKIYKILNI